MESANNAPTVEQIADLVVAKLTQGGKLSDLANADLLRIEEETLAQVDQVTRVVMNELLGKQSGESQPPQSCPKCRGPMCEKPSQVRLLQSNRGRVRFKTDVFRCEACRLDFFPSTENTGV